MNCKISNKITPGMPNIPTMTAFRGFIAILKPKKPPIKLNTNNNIPPSMAFNKSLIRNLIGMTNNSPAIYNNTIPTKKANKAPTDKSIKPPPLFL